MAAGRGRPALPAGGCPEVEPVFGGSDEAGADGILADVVRLFVKALLGAEAVVEKVALPSESSGFRGVAFPLGDGHAQSLVLW